MPTRCRPRSARWKATGATGTASKGYSGVGLHVSKALAPERPAFEHPAFDYENRIVTVDLPARDGRVGLRAERRQGLPGEDALPRRARAVRARRCTPRRGALVICGDLNIARTDMDVHPKERKPRAIGQLPGGARAARADHRPRPGRRRPRARARQRSDVHVVGAVAQHATAQHRLAPRLRPGQRSPSSTGSDACVVQREFGTSDHAPVVAEYRLALPGCRPRSGLQRLRHSTAGQLF